MKKFVFALLSCIFLFPNVSFGAENQAKKGPYAIVLEDNYKFKKVVEGIYILHDFTIQNKGTETLNIEGVKTGCGCTDVSYTRKIHPGGEGKITIKVNTKGFGGRKLRKTIRVYTNDKQNKTLNLVISGEVEKFVTITPKRVNLSGKTGDRIVGKVRIIPEKKYPFKIIDTKVKNDDNISCKIEETKGKGYLLTIENIRKEKGRYFDMVYLKTDSKIQPELKIRIYGNIMAQKQKGDKSKTQK